MVAADNSNLYITPEKLRKLDSHLSLKRDASALTSRFTVLTNVLFIYLFFLGVVGGINVNIYK